MFYHSVLTITDIQILKSSKVKDECCWKIMYTFIFVLWHISLFKITFSLCHHRHVFPQKHNWLECVETEAPIHIQHLKLLVNIIETKLNSTQNSDLWVNSFLSKHPANWSVSWAKYGKATSISGVWLCFRRLVTHFKGNLYPWHAHTDKRYLSSLPLSETSYVSHIC